MTTCSKGGDVADLSPVTSGDYLTALTATRDAIVADLAACESMRDKAALYGRLESTLKLIEAAKPAEQKGDVVDEIAKRRAARRASPASAAGRTKLTS